MNKEQIFLVKYGLHHFVSCANRAGKHVFCIRKSERENMIRHAKSLIEGGYGKGAEIQIV